MIIILVHVMTSLDYMMDAVAIFVTDVKVVHLLNIIQTEQKYVAVTQTQRLIRRENVQTHR